MRSCWKSQWFVSEGCETGSALHGLRTLPAEITVCYRVQEVRIDRSTLKTSVCTFPGGGDLWRSHKSQQDNSSAVLCQVEMMCLCVSAGPGDAFASIRASGTSTAS